MEYTPLKTFPTNYGVKCDTSFEYLADKTAKPLGYDLKSQTFIQMTRCTFINMSRTNKL